MIPPLTDRVFLGPSMPNVIDAVRAANPELFSLAESFNELAHREMFSTTVSKSDLQQVLLAALLHRLLTAFQAVVLLSERGMPSEVRLQLRKCLEVTFRIVAIAKDREVGRIYILEDEVHRKRFLNKFKLLSEPVRTPLEDSTYESLLAAIKQNISDRDIRELKTQWFAERAGLADFYHSAYSVLSESVHANVRDLESTLDIDSAGDFVGFKYGPSDEDLQKNLLSGMEALVLSLRAVFSVLDCKSPEELYALHAELDALYAKWHGETSNPSIEIL